MNQRKPQLMAEPSKTQDVIEQIAAKIKALREGIPMSQAALGKKIGLGEASVKSIEAGNNLGAYVKILNMASALKTTPNDILCVPATYPACASESRDTFMILLERSYQALGLPPVKAHVLARTVLTALDSPAIRKQGMRPEDIASSLSTLVDDKVLRFLREE